MQIVFAPRALKRLTEITQYLKKQSLSDAFINQYLERMERWLSVVLLQFPESGHLMPEYGENIRRISYQKYSFLYRIEQNKIQILTIFRENSPNF